MSARITAHVLRRLSVEACRDPRSVQKVLEDLKSGEETAQPATTASVIAAATRLGIDLSAAINSTRSPRAI